MDGRRREIEKHPWNLVAIKLEIMILTMKTREKYLARILDCLEPQLTPEVKVSIRVCDPLYTLGENREMMRRASVGEYICFVDDDDCVACDFVKTILPLLDGVDIIGYECQLYTDGHLDPHRDFHTITAGSWYNTETAFYRDISHLSPIRRDLALLAPMEGGHGEDGRWADKMRALGVLKTEHYIDRVMYYYLFRNGKNRGAICPKCGRDSTVMVEVGTHCNACGEIFNLRDAEQKSCLWI
jgi:hypothetical protein